MFKYFNIIIIMLSVLSADSSINFNLLNSNLNKIEFTFEIDQIDFENRSEYVKIN